MIFGKKGDGQGERPRQSTGEADAASFPKKLSRESRAGMRELPVVGSSAALKEMRFQSLEQIQAMLDKVSAEKLASEVRSKRRLLHIAIAIVGLAIVIWALASFVFHWRQVAYVTKFSLIAAPVCIVFGVSEFCMHIARSNPDLAQKVLGVLTFGSPHAIRNLAGLYIDVGNYEKAEKLISASIRGLDPKRKLRDYIIMHAFLANLKAHVGRVAEAGDLMVPVIDAAENHHAEHNTNGSAFLLADTFNYAAQLCNQLDEIRDALAFSQRAVSLLCEHKNPPVEVTLVALANTGYLLNVLGKYQEAMLFLNKANEIAEKSGIARDGQAAFILSNLAVAKLGTANAIKCKKLLVEAESRASAPLGVSQRPQMLQCWGIFHFSNSKFEEARAAYERALQYCDLQKPKETVLVLRILREYATLLQAIGDKAAADNVDKRSKEIKKKLDEVATAVPEKKAKKIKPVSVPVAKRSRIPVFWMILACLWGSNVYFSGIRIAKFTEWLLFLSALSVIAIKLMAKYGPKAKEETSQGAIVAVISLIPGLRSVVPELSVLPRKTASIILGTAVVTMILVQVTAPPPDTVPDGWLLPQEYLALGDALDQKESFNLARKAYEHAEKGDSHGIIGKTAHLKLLGMVPKNPQPEEAIQKNIKAVAMMQEKDIKAARALWEECIKEYPNFEHPYVHIAEIILQKDAKESQKKLIEQLKKQKTGGAKSENIELEDQPITAEEKADQDEAAALLKKAMEINPMCGPALLTSYMLKTRQHDLKTAHKYMNDYIKVSTGDGSADGGLTASLMKMADKMEDELEARKAERARRKAGAAEAATPGENKSEALNPETAITEGESKDSPAGKTEVDKSVSPKAVAGSSTVSKEGREASIEKK